MEPPINCIFGDAINLNWIESQNAMPPGSGKKIQNAMPPEVYVLIKHALKYQNQPINQNALNINDSNFTNTVFSTTYSHMFTFPQDTQRRIGPCQVRHRGHATSPKLSSQDSPRHGVQERRRGRGLPAQTRQGPQHRLPKKKRVQGDERPRNQTKKTCCWINGSL